MKTDICYAFFLVLLTQLSSARATCPEAEAATMYQECDRRMGLIRVGEDDGDLCREVQSFMACPLPPSGCHQRAEVRAMQTNIGAQYSSRCSLGLQQGTCDLAKIDGCLSHLNDGRYLKSQSSYNAQDIYRLLKASCSAATGFEDCIDGYAANCSPEDQDTLNDKRQNIKDIIVSSCTGDCKINENAESIINKMVSCYNNRRTSDTKCSGADRTCMERASSSGGSCDFYNTLENAMCFADYEYRFEPQTTGAFSISTGGWRRLVTILVTTALVFWRLV